MLKFENSKNIINLLYAKKKYSDIINLNNVMSFSKWSIKIIFKNEDPKVVDQYFRYVTNQYINKNYETKIYFLINLKKIIKKLSIQLNDIDQKKIILLEERIFSLERHIKVLKTNYKLVKGEFVIIKYVDAKIFYQTKILKLVHAGEMIISNKRIIFTQASNLNFWWNKIIKINYQENGIAFKYQRKQILINIHDAETLANNIRNIKSRIKLGK